MSSPTIYTNNLSILYQTISSLFRILFHGYPIFERVTGGGESKMAGGTMQPIHRLLKTSLKYNPTNTSFLFYLLILWSQAFNSSTLALFARSLCICFFSFFAIYFPLCTKLVYLLTGAVWNTFSLLLSFCCNVWI